MNLDSALAEVSQEVLLPGQPLPIVAEQPTLAVAELPQPPAVMTKIVTSLAMTTCLLMILSSVWWWQTSTQAWATVQKSVGDTELREGWTLRGQRQQIRTGLVQLRTALGARVVIEAPAEFRFESDQRLNMIRGRMSADVPPSARGFTVVTPWGDVVDLGTRFGVDVSSEGGAEIHVFEGEVIAQAVGERTFNSLRVGDAVTMAQGVSTARNLRSSAFIQSDEVPELTAALASGVRQRSDAAVPALRNDPALIMLLDFETAETPSGVFRMVQGRWPGSRAPEFINIGDHMRLNIGGDQQWEQLTLAAWVRLDHLGDPYQSLLHTDGWDSSKTGQVHWMINGNTTMRLALFGNTLAAGADERDGYPDSRTAVLPERERWVHLATVYDASAHTVRFYLNGQFDKETRQTIAYPARLGSAQIGNWNQTDRKLSGRIDELVILGRVMSDREIHELYISGCPYR
jgi:hypothetical protein